VHLKNDYASEYNLGAGVKGTTIAGLSANYQRVAWKNWNGTRPTVDYATGQRVGADVPLQLVLVKDKIAAQEDMQVFAYQRFNLLNDQVIVSGGVSQFWGVLERLDNSPVSPPLLPSTRNAVTDANWGIIYKPVKQVSLFAGYNRVGGALPSSIQAGDFATNGYRVGFGDQWEYGVKTAFLNGRITTSASYFKIAQTNVTAPNSAFSTDPTQPQFLFFDLRNKGWEFETNAAITKEFMLVGNYTHMHMRDTYGIPQRMVADNAGALFAKYTFAEGPVKGLGLSLGLDYVDKSAGDQTTLTTAAGVANQPSFYLAARTLLEAGVSYKRDKWSVGVIVNNLTNKDYIVSSSTRTNLVEGDPRNYSVTLDYRF
jgi:iron complex outermembrane receptor protein